MSKRTDTAVNISTCFVSGIIIKIMIKKKVSVSRECYCNTEVYTSALLHPNDHYVENTVVV